MKNRILICLMALVLSTCLFCSAFAQVVQPNDDFWYLDQANVLSEELLGEIFFANQRLYDACGAEIVVVAIDSTQEMAIDDYAYTLFNDWEIGGSKYLGMLLLMAIEDDDYYAMPGTMMGSYIDSASISSMLETYLEPDFAKGDYDAAVRSFFEAMYAEVVDCLNLQLSIEDAKADYAAFEQDQSAHAEVPIDQDMHQTYHSDADVVGWVIVIMLIALIILMRSVRRSRRAPAPPPPFHGPVHPPRRPFGPGRFVIGRMAHPTRRPPRDDHFPGMHTGMDHHAPNHFNTSSRGGFSDGGSGIGRSTPNRSSGGFGGASRGGSSHGGISTRGGGAGRFSRK